MTTETAPPFDAAHAYPGRGVVSIYPHTRTVLVDLDDTLADTDHRHHLLGTSKSPSADDWDAYHLACGNDKPIPWTIALVRSWAPSHNVALVSGRGVIAHDPTVDWLNRYDIPYHSLTLRSKGDHTSNADFKGRVASELLSQGHAILLGLDDHPNVIQRYQSMGIPGLWVSRPESRHTNYSIF